MRTSLHRHPVVALALSLTLLAHCDAQPISTFPYTQDFNSFVNGTVLSGGWQQYLAPADQAQWTVDDLGTPSAGTGPAGDAPSHGTGKYLYYETSGPAAGAQAHLRSPDFDISSTPGAVFQFWYHLCGVDIAGFYVDVWDPVSLTYMNVFGFPGPQQATPTTPWIQSPQIPFAPITGITHVRFRAIRGASFQGDSAMDLFEVYDASPPNVRLTAMTSPSSGCGLTSSEQISVTVANRSFNPAVSVPIEYTITGPISAGPIMDVIPVLGAFDPGSSFSFATLADLSVPGLYTITVTTMLPGDVDPTDDVIVKNIASGGTISIPICEDWESGPNGWTVNGTTTTFALGMPAGTVIIGPPPSGGVNSWMTNLTGSYLVSENGWVESPDFPFCDMVNPEVILDVWWNAEFSWDGAVLQSSTDQGATWQNIGAYLDPGNWYNDNTINGNPGGQQTGWSGRISTGQGSGGWVQATNTAPGLAGATGRVRIAFGSDTSIVDDGFAFDNLIIRETGLNVSYDTGASSPVSPVAAYEGTTGVVLLQFVVTASVGSDFLRSIDLIASGPGDDMLDVAAVHLYLEDPTSTNGVIDITDTLLATDFYPADDGTLSMPVLVSLPLGIPRNFLVAYDLGPNASGVSPPMAYTVTVSNPRVCGAVNPPASGFDPTGTVEVSPPPLVDILTVDAAATSVAAGMGGYSVSMTIENLSPNTISITSSSLSFTGTADRTSEYTVTPDPLNPTTVAPFAMVALDYSVDVSLAATPELITIDGAVMVQDTVTLKPWTDVGAAVTDSWSVSNCSAPSCGDCSGDLLTTVLDALFAAQHSVGVLTLTGTSFSNCNVTGSLEPDPLAVVDIIDALTIAQFSAGITVSLVCC